MKKVLLIAIIALLNNAKYVVPPPSFFPPAGSFSPSLCQNVLFADEAEDSLLKVIDFGFARLFPAGSAPLQTPCFTLQYAAPELFHKSGYDKACDLWSLGVILVCVLFVHEIYE